MDGFDIDFTMLPPSLQMKLWILALDANTSKVNLAYKAGMFRTSLAYNYGGKLEASLGVRRFSANLGVDPSNGDIEAGMVFKGFRFGVTPSFQKKSFGASIGFGAKLLPFPDELNATFNAAGMAAPGVLRSIREAPDNPLRWYNMHSDDIDTISKAVKLGQKIAGSGEKGLGMNLRLNASSDTGLLIFATAGYRF